MGAGRGRYYYTAVPEEPKPSRRFLRNPASPMQQDSEADRALVTLAPQAASHLRA